MCFIKEHTLTKGNQAQHFMVAAGTMDVVCFLVLKLMAFWGGAEVKHGSAVQFKRTSGVGEQVKRQVWSLVLLMDLSFSLCCIRYEGGRAGWLVFLASRIQTILKQLAARFWLQVLVKCWSCRSLLAINLLVSLLPGGDEDHAQIFHINFELYEQTVWLAWRNMSFSFSYNRSDFNIAMLHIDLLMKRVFIYSDGTHANGFQWCSTFVEVFIVCWANVHSLPRIFQWFVELKNTLWFEVYHNSNQPANMKKRKLNPLKKIETRLQNKIEDNTECQQQSYTCSWSSTATWH